MSRGALAGLKVLEFSDFVSGPYCAKLLADLSADVIKIENPGGGDRTRSYGPFPQDIPHPERSGLFLYLNTNKRGVTLNMDTATGRKIFLQLVKWADVLIENHLPQEMAALGLDYSSLKQVNPRLVVTSITPFGQTGPYRDYKGCDLTCSNMSGLAYINPFGGVNNAEQEPPLKGPMHAGDLIAGVIGAACTMSAAIAQQISGQGQQVDVSEQEAILSVIRRDVAVLTHENIPLRRPKEMRRREGGGWVKCRDGDASFVYAWQYWPRAKKLMGNPEWSDNPIFEDRTSRRENMDALKLLVQEWTVHRTRAELTLLAQENGIPCMPINSLDDVVNSDLLAARDFFATTDHPQAGHLKMPGAPFKLSDTPWQLNHPAPLLGEHNHQIYSDTLGYTKQELVKMRQEGVI